MQVLCTNLPSHYKKWVCRSWPTHSRFQHSTHKGYARKGTPMAMNSGQGSFTIPRAPDLASRGPRRSRSSRTGHATAASAVAAGQPRYSREPACAAWIIVRSSFRFRASTLGLGTSAEMRSAGVSARRDQLSKYETVKSQSSCPRPS